MLPDPNTHTHTHPSHIYTHYYKKLKEAQCKDDAPPVPGTFDSGSSGVLSADPSPLFSVKRK